MNTNTQAAPTGPVWDWAAGHGPVTGALSATTGALAVATTGAATGMPPTWALAIGTAGALGHTVQGLRARLAARTTAMRASSWLVAAGWTTWAMTTGPLTWAALGSLATIGVGIGAAARTTLLHEEARELEALAAEERAVTRELGAERRAIATQWTDRIQRVAGVKVKMLAVELWPTGTGFSLDAELPQGGITWDRIAQYTPQLSADARLPHGCTANVTRGIDQGRVILDVTTVNVLADKIVYPADYSPLSLLTGIPWGVRTNGDPVPVYLREQCALVVGPTGSGKTNMVHTILAGLARTIDTLTWVIDLNAGSAGLPWVAPALGDDSVRPGVDWLASTQAEAMLMLEAAVRIAKHRKVAYQQLLARADTDLLPISAEIPQIEIVIDEGAEILTSTDRELRKLAAKILEVIRIARAMGVRTVLTALGATGAVLGDLMIRREAKVRVALTGGETEGMNLDRLFPGVKGLRVDQAPYKGAGFLGTPESPAALFKSWRILPSQIRAIVAATSDRHPILDVVSAKAAGDVYARRWDAARVAWIDDSGLGAAHQDDGADSAPATQAGKASGGLNLSALRKAKTGEEELAREFRAQIDAQFATYTQAPTNEPEDEGLSAAPGLNLSALRNEDNAAKAAALDVLLAAGPEGTGASQIARVLADAHGTSRQTLVGWLKTWTEDGTAVRVGAGTKVRYIHHTHATNRPQHD